MELHEQIQKDLVKTYKSTIWHKVLRAIKDYDLIKPKDKIAVCISGGKDSILLAKCMQEYKRHTPLDVEFEYIVMNPGYTQQNLDLIKHNAKLLDIPIKIFDSDIFDIVQDIDDSPCYLCARMRRGCLYDLAQSLGCNKIALGHHFNDVIETILISMFYGSEYKTMMPKLKSTNHKGMELIRPLYLVKEQDIVSWKDNYKLEFLQCACKLTAKVDSGELVSKRKEIKQLIATLTQDSPNVDINIFRSIHNVNLDTILGYTLDGKHYTFLDKYKGE